MGDWPKPSVLKGLIHPTKGLLFDAGGQEFSSFGNGLIIVKTPDGTGVFDPETGWVLEPNYKHIRPIIDGLAPVFEADAGWGLMDIKGQWALEPQYHRMSLVSPDLLALAKDGLHYLADYSGAKVTEPRFLAVGYFENGLAKALKPGGDRRNWGMGHRTTL